MDFSLAKWVKQLRTPTRRPIRRGPGAAHQLAGVTLLEDRTLPTVLGTGAIYEGPAAGSDAVLVSSSGAWTATASDGWIHTTASGTGNGLAGISFDANPDGWTRSGTVTIDGQNVYVNQAGSDFAGPDPTGLPAINADLYGTRQAAIDSAGNVYIADIGHNRIAKYNPVDGTTSTFITSPTPSGVALDAAGNVYVDDESTHTVTEYDPSGNNPFTLTSGYTTGPVSGSFNTPQGIAVAPDGKVYIVDANANRFAVYNPNGQSTTELFDSSTLSHPFSVAVDAAGYVYVTETNGIFKYNPADGTSTFITTGVNSSQGVGVDGRGNVYFSDYAGNKLDVYNPQTGIVSTVMTGLNHPAGVAVTPAGDVVVADASDQYLRIVPQAYVFGDSLDCTSDSFTFPLAVMAADTIGLTGPMAPVSSQPWMTISDVSTNTVYINFAANTGATSRVGTVTVFGRTMTYTQEPGSSGAPTVDSPTVTGVTSAAATLGGTVESPGSSAVTRRGVLYAPTAVNPTPTLGGAGVVEVDDPGTGTGAFTDAVTGLTPGTPYSYVAFATNDAGTSYTTANTFATKPTVQLAAATQSVSATAGTFTVTVTLSSASTSDVSVPFTLGGTAAAGTDYANVTASPIVIPAGQTSKTITGTLLDPGYTPTNKTIVVTLGSNPTGADLGGTTADTVTVVSDPKPSVQFLTGSQNANASAGSFSVTVTLSGKSTVGTTVPFTLGGTAVNGTDYGNVSASPVTIPAGQTSVTITGSLNSNPSATTNPTLTFTLGTPTNANLGGTTTDTLTIVEPNLKPTTVDVGGLEFKNANGFDTVGNSYTVTGPVQVGLTPANGQSFVALLALQGTVTIDRVAGTVTNTGAVQAVVGSTTALNGTGLSGATIVNLLGGGAAVAAGSSLTAAHVPFTPTTLSLTNSGPGGVPSVLLGGTLTLPYGLTLAVSGSNHVVLNSAGTTLTGVTATVPSQSFTLGGVAFSGLTLSATYNQPADKFVLTGGGTATFTTPNGNVAVQMSFGQNSSAGVVFTAGSLTALDAAVTTAFTVRGVAFTANGLGFSYATATSTFSLAGTASAAVAGMGALSVTFGHGSTPGLVVTNGALVSLDTTVTSNLTAGGVSFATQNDEFSYTASTGQYALAGSATATVSGLGAINVSFGHGTTPGLVVTNGALTSLDMTLNTNLSAGNVTFTTNGLEFTYTAAGSQYTLAGSATAAVSGLGTIGVTFGHGSTPGLTVSNGALVNLDTTLSTNLTVSAVTFATTGLEFKYTAAGNTFSLSGTTSATIAKLGNLSLTFGHGSTPGLVVTNGALTSLDTTLNSDVTVAGVKITTTGLELKYTAATGTFALSGSAAAAVSGLGSLAVTFGHGSTPGLVVTNGSLVSLDMTLNTDIKVGSLTFSTTGLEFAYTAANSQFSLTGSASTTVGRVGSLAVTFGHGSTPGLVVTNGSLVSLDMTLNTDISVASVKFSTTGLEFTYTAANSQYTLAGTVAASVTGLGNLSLTFGHGSTPGLVITSGALTSLDLTLNTDITVGAVKFSTTGLEFTYTAANSQYTLAGTATGSIAKLGTISVTFGHGSTPGLVITNGSLTSLDMTLNTDINVGAVTITTKGLEFTYTAANSQYTLAGTASATIAKLGTISVTFGHGSTPGLVVTNGSLVSLDMTLNTNIKVGSLTFSTQGLEFTYTAATSTYTLAGTASVSVLKIGSISVTFGHGSTPGLVISNGSLVSLDMTLNTNIRVNSVTFTTQGLEFTYTAATDQYTLAGTAGVTIVGIGNLSVTFGHGSTPGLVITNGSLVSLDLTVNSNIRVEALVFSTTGLEFTYTASTDTFTLGGTAGVTILGVGQVSVTFGHGSTPGLVIANGSLVSLDLTLNSDIRVGSALFSTTGLEFAYTTATSKFTLSGTAGVTVAGVGNLFVTFGHGSTPGLVITNGSLVSLDMTVNSSIRVGAVVFSTTGLEFTYTTASNTFTLAGSAGVGLVGVGGLTVTFGHGSTPGLVITNGSLVSLDMTVGSDFNVGLVKFTGNGLEFKYTAANSLFTLSGTAGVTVTGIGKVTVTFGHGSTPGLVVTNGSLTSLDMTVNSDISLAVLTFKVKDLEFKYTAANDTFTIRGSATLSLGFSTFNVQLGNNSGSQGVVITNGSVASLDGTVSDTFGVAGLSIGTVSLHFSYVKATNTYDFDGTADLTLTASLPGFFSNFISLKSVSLHIGSVSLHVHDIPGNNSDSYASFSASLAGYNVGVKITFSGGVTVTGISDAIVQGLLNAAGKVVNAAGQIVNKAASTVVNGLKSAGSAISSGASSVWHAIDNDLAGATVFYDANGNGVQDGDEPSTVTAADGTFTISIPAGGGGQLVVFGGTNVATGLPNTAVFTAPADAKEVSPLTTLIQAVRAANSTMSEDEATAAVTTALGIPDSVDVLNDYVISKALTGNADAARAFNAAVELAGVVGGANALVGGPSAAGTSAVFANLAAQIGSGDGTLNLTDPTVVQQAIQAAADQAGVTIDPAVVSGAAAVLAGVNGHIESMPASGGADYMTRVVKSQIAAGTTAVPALVQAAAGQADIASVVAANTGDAFAATAAAVKVGALAAPVSDSSPMYAVGAGAGGGARVQVYDRQTGSALADFLAFEPTFRGGTNVAVGDVNGDGVADVVIAAGSGGAARIIVVDGTKLNEVAAAGQVTPDAELADFFAFESSFSGGATVALGHLSGGAGLDIIVGAGAGGGPRVRTFAYAPGVAGGVTQLAGAIGDFFAFDPSSRIGVNVAAGDLDGTGRDDVIVGAGDGGAPAVAVFNPDGTLRNEFMAYDPSLRGGVSVAAGYLDGTAAAQLVTGAGVGGPSSVNVYAGTSGTPERTVQVFDPSFTGGVVVSSGAAGGQSDVVVGAASGAPRVSVLTADGLTPVDNFFGFEPTFQGGVSVG